MRFSFCWLFAVEAFSKQGVNGLPNGVLLDPWNEEAVLQAQQVGVYTAASTGSELSTTHAAGISAPDHGC
jgi:hypothetical protein